MSDDEAGATRVTVVTGFLGAGKTTLLNRWLGQYARGEVAVVVNEFGAVGVDGELLAERAREVVELTGGCVCCATQEELSSALADFARRENPPRRVFVETSGAASPAGVLRAVLRNPAADSLRLDGVVTVVDARRVDALAESDLALEQVGYADVVVLSRAGACQGEALSEVRASLRARNGAALFAAAERGELLEPPGTTLEALLAARTVAELPAVRWVPRTRHDPGIESVSLALPGEVDEERFAAWVEEQLARFEGRLLRIKGVLAVAGLDERMVLQGVADQVEVSFGAAWGDVPRASRVVLVGFGLDAPGLEASFRACAAETYPEG